MKRGLLLEIKGRTGVLLTKDGEFVRVRLPKGVLSVGSEIVAEERPLFLISGKPLVWTTVAVVLLALLLPVWSGWWTGYGTVLAYVSVDVNPSIELGVGQQGRVLSVVPLNSDGEKLLADKRYYGRDLPVVLEDITNTAITQGYIKYDPTKPAETILIVAVPARAGQVLPEHLLKALQRGEDSIARQLHERSVTADIKMIQSDSHAIHEQAGNLQLSMGRYLLLLEAQRELAKEVNNAEHVELAEHTEETKEEHHEPVDVAPEHDSSETNIDYDPTNEPVAIASEPSDAAARSSEVEQSRATGADQVPTSEPVRHPREQVHERPQTNNQRPGERPVPPGTASNDRRDDKNDEERRTDRNVRDNDRDDRERGQNRTEHKNRGNQVSNQRSTGNNVQQKPSNTKANDKGNNNGSKSNNDKNDKKINIELEIRSIRDEKFLRQLREHGLELKDLLQRLEHEVLQELVREIENNRSLGDMLRKVKK